VGCQTPRRMRCMGVCAVYVVLAGCSGQATLTPYVFKAQMRTLCRLLFVCRCTILAERQQATVARFSCLAEMHVATPWFCQSASMSLLSTGSRRTLGEEFLRAWVKHLKPCYVLCGMLYSCQPYAVTAFSNSLGLRLGANKKSRCHSDMPCRACSCKACKRQQCTKSSTSTHAGSCVVMDVDG
jgi:hypothetical protein